jgi:hypothetical protein
MTPRGRVALVLGLVIVAAAMLASTVTIHAGLYDCGSAVSAHEPTGKVARARVESLAEHRCNGKVTGRRYLVALVGGGGLLLALAGAFDHEPRRAGS